MKSFGIKLPGDFPHKVPNLRVCISSESSKTRRGDFLQILRKEKVGKARILNYLCSFDVLSQEIAAAVLRSSESVPTLIHCLSKNEARPLLSIFEVTNVNHPSVEKDLSLKIEVRDQTI